MWPYYPELLARPVPRYTSYPTAAEFHDGVGEADQLAALAAIAPDTPISVYVHIPYCREICWYCGCNTGAATREERLASYVDALEAEIDLVAHHLGGRGQVARIAFGGGSPNALSPLRFVRLLDRLVTRFEAASAEVAIELDPRSLESDWFDVIATANVARASLGVQTFAPHIQRAIGRVQPEAMIADVVRGLRNVGVRSINFDLMYGLPDQRFADLTDTLDRTIALGADRVALFGYAHIPSLIPRQRRIDGAGLPGADERFAQAALGHERLVAAGYRAVGFDHFAKPHDDLAIAAASDRVRRNFQGFTDDPCNVMLGLGATAISMFPGLIVQNEKMAGPYRGLCAEGRLAGRRGTRLSVDDMRRGTAIERLLCAGEARIDNDLLRQAAPVLEPFARRGLVSFGREKLVLEPEGLFYARAIASSLDGYRELSNGTFSHAV